MKLLSLLAAFCILITSCSHKITRTGYNAPSESVSTCEAEIKYANETTPDPSAQLLGSIKLGDTGFSTNCNEEKAMSILKQEACALHANLVLITDYSTPGFASTCYRCSASFYAVTKTAQSDSIQSPPSTIKKAAKYTSEPNPIAGVVGYVVGFAVGFLLVSLLF